MVKSLMAYRDYRDAEIEKLKAEVLALREENEKLCSMIDSLTKPSVVSPVQPRLLLPPVEKPGVYKGGGSFLDWFR